MAIYTVDSVEDGIAHLLLRENESISIHVEAEQLPGIKEGDIIEAKVTGRKVTSFKKLEKQTNNAKAYARELMQKLMKKNQK
ncbi:DUF3006 domain-containing protein [Halalkalibacter alkaliphilus]|uniref:DUF3006 domain-containing protein n=1 Tax=Halalkalibacter alkaliphilus TaxID=2917993 RepID=A0A9X2I6W3_9BACI|nr:DUF3006 domain-containing protein [Halalkalibacter alkaliphilus]MCL7747999.1 DUF3006 domain-containing protein [Halalkalibacter alkaliphilus]